MQYMRKFSTFVKSSVDISAVQGFCKNEEYTRLFEVILVMKKNIREYSGDILRVYV